uniref:Uncharacterized protein n=1 Tax=Mola mola TaxID=94237 RepID=A0A3Q3VMK1_MOLML
MSKDSSSLEKTLLDMSLHILIQTSCLGPLTFHCQAMGDKVSLSQGCRGAERMGPTFKNGLVFSSRPLWIKERVHLKIETGSSLWHGALRVGFTNVPPAARSLPLPPLAIPNLTDRPGHWAAPLVESKCPAGLEMEFWVSSQGIIYITNNNSRQQKLLIGVDVRQPLWAMIDIYGQTSSVLLLGSKKRGRLCTRRSCPALGLNPPDTAYRFGLICFSSKCFDSRMMCVLCMERDARITLPCGHRCLCKSCSARVVQVFDSCPLCRQSLSSTSGCEL